MSFLTDSPTFDGTVTLSNGPLVLASSSGIYLSVGGAPSSTSLALYQVGGALYFNGSVVGGLSNPMTTLGDILYGGTSGVATRLAGNTSTAMTVLTQTGTGSTSASPAWTPATVTIGTTSITLGSSSTTLTGLSSVTSNLFSGALNGTVGATTPAAGKFTGLTLSVSTYGITIPTGTPTSTTNTIYNSSGTLYFNGSKIGAGFSNPMTTLGDIIYENATPTATRLAGNVSSTMAVLTQTGTGTISAIPVWTSTTGTGNIVRATAPSLTTPSLGAATASSINGVTISPTTSATLSLDNGSSLITSGAYSLVFTTISNTNVTLPSSGTLIANPMANLGDVMYGGASGVVSVLAGNTSIAMTVLTQTGTGSASASPAWTPAIVTVGTTPITLGSSSTTLTGLTSVNSTAFIGSLTGNATTATKLASSITITADGDASGSDAISFDGSSSVSLPITLLDTVITGKLLTNYSVGSNTAITATDSIRSAFSKLQGQINSRITNYMTTLGDLLYGGNSGVETVLHGEQTTTPHFLTSTGTGTAATAPTWTGSTGSGNVVCDTSPSLTTPSLGAATATSINGNTITTGSGILTLANVLATSGAYPITLTATAVSNVTMPASGSAVLNYYTSAPASANLLTCSLSSDGSLKYITAPTIYSILTQTNNSLSPAWVTATGSGSPVCANSPTLITPTLGVASATSINKVAITAPSTNATLTIANGSSLITSGAYSITLTATTSCNATFPASSSAVLNYYTSAPASANLLAYSGAASGLISYIGAPSSTYSVLTQTSNAAAPAWVTSTGSGSPVCATSPTITTPSFTTGATFSASAAQTTEGMVWKDSTQYALTGYIDGIKQHFVGNIFSQTADGTTSGTSAITMFGTGVGTKTLPANFWVVGKAVRIKLYGFATTQATPGTITATVMLGSTTVNTTGAVTPSASLANANLEVEVILTCRSTGSSGTIMATGQIKYTSSTKWNALPFTTTTVATVNTTASQVIDILSTNSVSGGTVFVTKNATIEVLS